MQSLTLQQVCNVLKVSPRTAHKWVNDDRLCVKGRPGGRGRGHRFRAWPILRRIPLRVIRKCHTLVALDGATRRSSVKATTVKGWADQHVIDVISLPGGHRRLVLEQVVEVARLETKSRQMRVDVIAAKIEEDPVELLHQLRAAHVNLRPSSRYHGQLLVNVLDFRRFLVDRLYL